MGVANVALGFGISGFVLAWIALWFALMAHERLDRMQSQQLGGKED